jgi:hypothetical protein
MRTALLAVVLAMANPTGGKSALSSTDLVGTYFSSMLGGCWLKIGADRVVNGRCADDLELNGSLMPTEQGLIVLAFVTDGLANPTMMLMTTPQDQTPSWPPSVRDPTVPLFAPTKPRFYNLMLHAVRWGPRVYLVRRQNLDDFCHYPDVAKEPRSVAPGEEFLRAGDERLRIAKDSLPECSLAEEWTRGPPNERLELTAPLGGRSGNVVLEAATSRSPFGERRRRSSSAVLGTPWE